MNLRLVIKQLAIMILLVAASMSSALVWALIDRDRPDSPRIIFGFLVSIALCLIVGLTCYFAARRNTGPMYRKEAIAIVGLGWLLAGLLGACPYIFCGVLESLFPHTLDALAAAVFESFSGFTGTGASIFPDVESLPRAILFWRGLTHWLAGMGIVVLFVAILGRSGPAAKLLVSSELTGPLAESIRPRAHQTSMMLWMSYLALSAALLLCLLLQGLSLFEALCHTFATIATGGFSTLNTSIGQYHRLSIEITIIIFLVLAGTNFTIYGALLQGRFQSVLRNKEWRVYLLLLLMATLLITADLSFNASQQYSLASALRYASFQAVSIMTTTGFATADFNTWPQFSRWFLVVLMFIGGSAGSTSAGLKVIRVLLFFRLIRLEIEHHFRPAVVRPLKISDQDLDDDSRRAVLGYVALVFVTFLLATAALLVLQNHPHISPDRHLDLPSAFSAVATTMNGVGPGLNLVGPLANFAFLTAPAKLLLCLLMILGRLEYLTIFCLLLPSFWRQD